MKLSHNGEEWHGTFGVTLAAMLDDLLSDGFPIGIRFTIAGTPEPKVYDCRVFEVVDGQFIETDGDPVDLDAVLSAEML